MTSKILVDGRLLSNHPTGISRYTKEIINALEEQYGCDNIQVLVNEDYINSDNFNVTVTKLKPYNPIHFILFPFFVSRLNFSIYYSTFYSGIWSKLKNRKQILTVHDLMYLLISNYFSGSSFLNAIFKSVFNWIVRCSLRTSDRIICVSETTKKDLLNYFKSDSVVIREGVNFLEEDLVTPDTLFDRFKINKGKYFLYVGNFRKQKNVPFLIAAFLNSTSPDQLVLVGDHKGVELKNERIIYTGILRDPEIQQLYKSCTAFVLPSYYEGFGLPILEAYNAGAKILSSNQGALIELNNLKINYFSPLNRDELVSLIQNVENLARPTETDIEMARKNYNWKTQTNKIIKIIDSLL